MAARHPAPAERLASHPSSVQATEAIKPILGEYYMYDAREVHAAL